MGYHNRHSDEFKKGKRDGGRAYSDYGYDSSKYRQHGSERQRNYAGGWDEAREEKHQEERRREEQEEQEEQERMEQRHAEQRAQERHEQECYEQQMYEEQQQQYEQETEE